MLETAGEHTLGSLGVRHFHLGGSAHLAAVPAPSKQHRLRTTGRCEARTCKRIQLCVGEAASHVIGEDVCIDLEDQLTVVCWIHAAVLPKESFAPRLEVLSLCDVLRLCSGAMLPHCSDAFTFAPS